GAVILPATATGPITEAGVLTNSKQTVVALWRGPERMSVAKPLEGRSVLVDVATFGEFGLLAARRGANRLPAPLPLGTADPSRRAAGAPTLVETSRGTAGTLALRGRMVPSVAPGSGSTHPLRFSTNAAGYVDTGWICRFDADGIIVAAPPPGHTA